jgi:hypothetical protein
VLVQFNGKTCSGVLLFSIVVVHFLPSVLWTQSIIINWYSTVTLFATLWFRIFESALEGELERQIRQCVACPSSLKVRRGVVSPQVRAPNVTSSSTDEAAPPRRSIPRPWRVCNPLRFTTVCISTHVTHLSSREFWDPRPLTPYCGHCRLFAPDRPCLLQDYLRRVVSIPASYSGGPGFKSWPGDRLSWLRRIFVGFQSPYRQMPA